MRRKIIDDFCFQYLNDLVGIKLIILQSELNVPTFWICMDATFFSMSLVFNNFPLIDATARSKISSDKKCLFFAGTFVLKTNNPNRFRSHWPKF